VAKLTTTKKTPEPTAKKASLPIAVVKKQEVTKPVAVTEPCRKRKAVLPSKLVALACDEESFDKKRKLETRVCQGHVFPERKPLQSAADSKSKLKLTASVAPLIKSQPTPIITSKTTSTAVTAVPQAATTVPQQPNPILLLPVSLQGNNDIEGVQNRNVGGLSLVTVQAPPNFLNCLRLNKTATGPIGSSGQWVSGSTSMMDTHTVPFQLNVKNPEHVRVNQLAPQAQTSLQQNSIARENRTVQLEPLNLKVDQTKASVPSTAVFSKSMFTQARLLKPVTVKYPRILPKEKLQIPADKKEPSGSAATKSQPITTKLLLRSIAQAKSHKGSRLNALSKRANEKLSLSASIIGTKKRQSNCPSPGNLWC